MAHTKNNPFSHTARSRRANSYHSSSLHSSKTRLSSGFESTSSKSPAQKIIFTVILLNFIIVGIALILTPYLKSEYIVKSQISSLATDYYENYLYSNFTDSGKFANLDAAMNKYATHGFARITLRQLLLHNQLQNTSTASYLLEHCDDSATFVQFFPESPYSQSDYRTEYTYSCNF
ncbi:hypothetical protein IJF93_02830 [Candidatus Saccharibacteria bacterium]|nr:hypothetical protein [Candidatus Saccharibacteria bacterium]